MLSPRSGGTEPTEGGLVVFSSPVYVLVLLPCRHARFVNLAERTGDVETARQLNLEFSEKRARVRKRAAVRTHAAAARGDAPAAAVSRSRTVQADACRPNRQP